MFSLFISHFSLSLCCQLYVNENLSITKIIIFKPMKPKLLSFGLLLMSLFSMTSLKAQPNYVQPTAVVPNWAHANSQSLYSIKITSNGKTLLDYVDALSTKAYNWLQDTKFFDVAQGDVLTIDVRSGIWTWDIHLGFDWDGDGTFEDIHRAFANGNSSVSEANSSWGSHAAPYNNGSWRNAELSRLGHRGVLHKEFTVTVPATAQVGNFRMRVLCDGDGYGPNGVPPFNMTASIGYAGSMTDFGIHVSGKPKTEKPVASVLPNTYKEDQEVSLTSDTEGARIYYTTDGTEPSETNGTLYDPASPIVVSVPEFTNGIVTLKAIAYSDELEPSSVASYVYKIQKAWSEPGGTFHTTENRFITEAKTTGAKVDLDYSELNKPEKVYIDTQKELTVEPNSTFELSVKCFKELLKDAATNTWVNRASMRWCHAIIFVDWNRNFSFDDEGEQLYFIGKENAGVDEVGDFVRTITVPEDARPGKTRLRIQYTDAWHKKSEPNHTHSGDDDVDKGRVYDFILNIEKAIVDYGININGVDLNSANADNLTFADAEGYVSCDGDTLTLHNFKLNATKGSAEGLVYLKSDKDVVVKLVGENSLTTTEDYKTGIYVAAPKVTFVGGGSLVVDAPNDAAIFAFKTCNEVAFKDSCTVEAKGKWGLLGSTSLEGQTLTVDSCVVKATGTDCSIQSFKNVQLNSVVVKTPAEVDYTDGTFKVNGTAVTEEVVIAPSETTGIVEVVPAVAKKTDAIYNLNGVKMEQRLQQLPKGIYIVNGKKVVVK